jgi:1,4-dihydroxy-2-naphthoyl-CoA hydrolase
MSIWFHEKLDLAALSASGANCMPGFVGIEFIGYGDNWIKARMPVDERTKQPYGRLHGGASVVLAETVGSTAAAMTVDPSKFATVGMEINANHIRGVASGWVNGIARPVHIGRSTQVWQIDMTDDQGRTSCVSRLTLSVLAPRG